MRIGTVIQARTGSSRLPGKILLSLPYGSNISALAQVIRRSFKSDKSSIIIVATTENTKDNPIIDIASNECAHVFRGPEDDVLARYYYAAQKFNLDIIVRVTSDCPCINWKAIDRVVDTIISSSADYVRIKGNHPLGTEDVEAFTFKALGISFKEASQDFEREHVSPYIWKTSPQKFKIVFLQSSPEVQFPNARVTLDTIEDYALLCAIFDFLYEKKHFFDTLDIVSLFRQKPWLKIINSKVRQKQIFDTFEQEFLEALKILELQDLKRMVVWLKQQKKILS